MKTETDSPNGRPPLRTRVWSFLTWATGGGPWWKTLLVHLIALGLLIWAGWYIVTHPWPGLAYIGFVLGIFALVILQFASESANAWVERIGNRLGQGLTHAALWFVVVFIPILGARYTAEAVADVPIGIAVALLVVWFAVFALLVREVWSERRRRQLYRSWREIDRVMPFLYPFALAFVAIILFATLAFVLAERDVIQFGEEGARATVAEPADALDFFLWHLVDAIPVLDATRTLRWEEPMGYTDGAVGFLVLMFKIVVIIPIVATFLAFLAYSREAAAAGASPNQLRPDDLPPAPRPRDR